MTPEEAIETLGNMIMQLHPPMPLGELNALNLGIEALKAIKLARETYGANYPMVLLGETKE